MWIMNLGQPVNVPPMNENMAIELGANLLGEGILFVIAAALLIYEYSRQSANTEKKEKLQKEELDALRNAITELSMTNERQNTQIRELYRSVLDIDSRVVKVPWGSKRVEVPAELEPEHVEPPHKIVNDQSVINEAISYIQQTVYRHHMMEPPPMRYL